MCCPLQFVYLSTDFDFLFVLVGTAHLRCRGFDLKRDNQGTDISKLEAMMWEAFKHYFLEMVCKAVFARLPKSLCICLCKVVFARLPKSLCICLCKLVFDGLLKFLCVCICFRKCNL